MTRSTAGLDANRPNWIGEQGRDRRNQLPHRRRLQRDQRGVPHQRIGVAQPTAHRGIGGRARVAGQQFDSRRAHDRWIRDARSDGDQAPRCARAAAAAGVDGLAVVGFAAPLRAVPARDPVGRPLRRAFAVARVAGVRGAELHRQVGPRHPQAVVATRIDHHVGRRRHVAVGALGAARALGMEVMRLGVVLRREVALRAHRVARRAQLLRVRVVAVAARHARAVHPALQERTPDEHLVALLAVGVIEARRQQRRQVVIHQRGASLPAFGDLRATRVAGTADFDLAAAPELRRALRVSARGIDLPRGAAPFVERNRQALRRVGRWLAFRPGEMRGTRAVARLAADADLRPLRGERVLRGVVALAHVRGVTVGAHEVPVLRTLRPVQFVAEV